MAYWGCVYNGRETEDWQWTIPLQLPFPGFGELLLDRSLHAERLFWLILHKFISAPA
jgi:hypothetical protein